MVQTMKGMGLIMLILIGTVPTAYALNRAMPDTQMVEFSNTSTAAAEVIERKSSGFTISGGNPRQAVTAYVSERTLSEATYPALAGLVKEISGQVSEYGSIRELPAEAIGNTRNDMYLASEAIRFLLKDRANDLSKEEVATLGAYKKSLDGATKFIPLWVKVAVAIALGLGTMIGWKRIVVTVGEKIGKSHLTYAQGAAAEVVAAYDHRRGRLYGSARLDHSCAVIRGRRHHGGERVGTAMVDGAQPAARWVLTLPIAILLSATLFYVFATLF